MRRMSGKKAHLGIRAVLGLTFLVFGFSVERSLRRAIASCSGGCDGNGETNVTDVQCSILSLPPSI